MPFSKKVIVRSARKKSKVPRNVPANSATYNGPIGTSSVQLKQSQLTVIRLTRALQATTNGSGVMSAIIGGNPSSATNWSSFAALWDEYRLLSMEVIYVPSYNNTYNSTVLSAPFVHCIDRDAAGGLSSLSQGLDYESASFSNTGRMHRVKINMTGIEDAGFINSASPGLVWSYFNYASGLSASTTYGEYFVIYEVQFRGRV